MLSPFTPTELNFIRDRTITEVTRRFESTPNITPIENVERLFNRIAFTSNKANVLASALGREAQKYFIPVPDSLIEVRQAVSRKSEDGNGSRISFDLFRNALEAKQREKRELEQIPINGIIGSDEAFSKEFRRVKAKHGLIASGLEPDAITIEMFISQFLILYIANSLTKPFRNLEEILPAASQRVPIEDEPTAEIPIFASILLGLACQLVVMGLNDLLMEEYLQRAAGNYISKDINLKDLIKKARALSESDNQLSQITAIHAGLNDYEIILRYSFEYLSKTVDPGYEFWIAYAEAVKIRYTVQSMWVHAPFYSIPHALVRHQGIKPKKGSSKNVDKLKFIRDLALQIIPMTASHYDIRQQTINNADNALDTIAQVLTSNYTSDAICCFAHFFIKLPPKTRKIIRGFTRGMLRASRDSIRAGIVQLGTELMQPSFEEFMALEISHQIDRFFAKTMNEIMSLISPEMAALECCPIVGEIQQVLLEGLWRLEEQLKRALKIIAIKMTGAIDNALGVNKGGTMYRAQIEYESRILRQILKIIDAAGKIAARIDSCSPETGVVEAGVRVPNLTLDSAEINEYFGTADDKNFDLTGRFLPAIGKEITSMPTQAFYREKAKIEGKHTCMSPASEEDIREATKIIQDFKGSTWENQ